VPRTKTLARGTLEHAFANRRYFTVRFV